MIQQESGTYKKEYMHQLIHEHIYEYFVYVCFYVYTMTMQFSIVCLNSVIHGLDVEKYGSLLWNPMGNIFERSNGTLEVFLCTFISVLWLWIDC